MEARVARGLCGLLRPFGTLVFTFDRLGRGELVLEDLEQAHQRIAMWVEANRNAIEVVRPLEQALDDGEDPIQGMVTGSTGQDEAGRTGPEGKADGTRFASASARNIRRAICRSWICCRRGFRRAGRWSGSPARLGVDRKETMAIGDNWNDVDMLEWAGQGVLMGNAAHELRAMAKMRGWKQAPPNDQDGVAVVLEAEVARLAASARR